MGNSKQFFYDYKTDPKEIVKQLKNALTSILSKNFFIDVRLVEHQTIKNFVYVCIALGPRRLLFDDDSINRLYIYGEVYLMNPVAEIRSIKEDGEDVFSEKFFFQLFESWNWQPFDMKNGQYILRLKGHGHEDLNNRVRKFIQQFEKMNNV